MTAGGTHLLPRLRIELPITPLQEKVVWNVSYSIIGLGFAAVVVITFPLSAPFIKAGVTIGTSVILMYIDVALNAEAAKKAAEVIVGSQGS